MARNWVVVGGPEIFAKTREMGFTRHGFKSTRRNMANSIQPGDLLAFYVTGRKQFAAIARRDARKLDLPVSLRPRKGSSSRSGPRWPRRLRSSWTGSGCG